MDGMEKISTLNADNNLVHIVFNGKKEVDNKSLDWHEKALEPNGKSPFSLALVRLDELFF